MSEPAKIKAAIYLRISTDRQDQANQLPDVIRLAEARGFDVAGHVYEEVESSAKVRPVYEGMMNDARRGKFRALAFWALDRLGRNMWETIAAIKELDRLGVQVVSVKEPWFDTSGPVRDLLIAIFSWVGQHERDRIRARTVAALRAARDRGVQLGRPRVEFDLDKARSLRAAGLSYRRIAEAVGVSVATVHEALVQRPALAAASLAADRPAVADRRVVAERPDRGVRKTATRRAR